LNDDYRQALMEGNTFIQDRIKKYMKRGFTVQIRPSHKIIELKEKTKIPKDDESWYRWFVIKIYKFLLTSIRDIHKLANKANFVLRYPLQPQTIERIDEICLDCGYDMSHPGNRNYLLESIFFWYHLKLHNEYNAYISRFVGKPINQFRRFIFVMECNTDRPFTLRKYSI